MKTKNNILTFILGAIAMLLLLFAYKKITKFTDENEKTDYYIITNQITKMNKMVVLEQDFSMMQKTKASFEVLGSKVSEHEIMTFTKTNAQVSYDLNKMKIKVDSVNKKIIIKELPEANIRISPNVEITGMDDSFFNRIGEDEIKKVTENAKKTAIEKIDQNALKSQSKKQLMQNLNQIFVLAKALNYKIEDETKTLDLSEL